MRTSAAVLLLTCPVFHVHAQLLGPAGPVSSSGEGTAPVGQLSWSLGQVASATYKDDDLLITAGLLQPDGVLIGLNVRMLLGGPFVPVAALMIDSLRTKGLLPAEEPYTDAGYQHAGTGGGEQVQSGVMLVAGPDAIVDWVVLELRAPGDVTAVVSTRSALVQRDGDVVDMDGVSAVRMSAPPGPYHVLVRHRNHLPVMTAAAHVLGPVPVLVDLSSGSASAFGTDAQRVENSYHLLWPGNVVPDALVRYSGSGNDRDPILQAIGGTVPTATITGYLPTDVNMDGTVKYSGAGNDRDPILQTIGGTVPTATRAAQIP